MDRSDFGNPFGVLMEESDYHVFIPGRIPPKIEYDNILVGEINRTEGSLGELRATAESFPIPKALERLFGRMEAVKSSSIEGTTASFQDTLRWDLDQMSSDEARRLRMREVLNCRSILQKRWPDARSGEQLNNDTIKVMHRSLWHDMEGEEMFSGEYRLHQNWIGGGGNMDDATYIPPPPRYVPTLMDELEAFINDPVGVPGLLQCAIVHYQFEAIHPFHDGNGRVGRIMLCLMLSVHAQLIWPLDISTYIRRKQIQYQNSLFRVSTCSEWYGWFRFVLGVIQDVATGSIRRIRLLQEEIERCKGLSSTSNGIELVDMLVEHPMVTIPQIRARLGMSYPGAKHLVETFVEIGILTELHTKRKPRLFFAPNIMKLVHD